MCCMINISNLANVSEKETNERAGDKKWVGCWGEGEGEGEGQKELLTSNNISALFPYSLPPNLNQPWSERGGGADNFTTEIRVKNPRQFCLKNPPQAFTRFLSHIDTNGTKSI